MRFLQLFPGLEINIKFVILDFLKTLKKNADETAHKTNFFF